MKAESLAELLGVQRAGLAETANSSSSTALSSVFEPQNASPSCMIASGVTCSTCSGTVGLTGLLIGYLVSDSRRGPQPIRAVITPLSIPSGSAAKPLSPPAEPTRHLAGPLTWRDFPAVHGPLEVPIVFGNDPPTA